MPVSGSQRRYCLIDDEGGPITVRLMANRMLRAAGTFTVWSEQGEVSEEWGMAAGDTGESDHEMGSSADSVDRNVLSWEILVCSMHPGVDSGTVQLLVLQDGAPVPMTKPAAWNLTDVPSCESGEAIPIRAGLIFRAQ